MTERVVIIGGGVVGSATAYFLRLADPTIDVTVLERDPTYSLSSSARSAASIRQQFSTPLSVQMSLFGIYFLRGLGERLAVDGRHPSIDLHEGGYLFLATPAGLQTLNENHALQTALGADIALMDPAQLGSRFPWLNTADLAAAAYGRSGEGWFDGYGLVQAFRKKAQALGATYVAAEANAVTRDASTTGSRVTAVLASNGQVYPSDTLVNAAGAWSRRVTAMMDIDLPVHARRRSVFHVSSPAQLPDCPLLIDPSGVYFRPEGKAFICGSSPSPDDDFDDSLDEVDHALFETVIWPTLAKRVPGFEALAGMGCNKGPLPGGA